MPDSLTQFLRAVLALALIGLGPVTRMADVLTFHVSGIPTVAVHQLDDGTAPLPHGDGCLLAVASAPATPAMWACGDLALAPAIAEVEPIRSDLPVVLRATGPPATRAPPRLT